MEVVEQPFGGGRCRLASPDIFGERGIDLAKHAGVLVEPFQMRAAAATRPPDRSQDNSKPAGVFLERLDPQQLDAAGRLRTCARDVSHW